MRPWMLCLLVAGCAGADPSKGAEQLLRVPSGQLTRQRLPADQGGPRVTFVDQRAPTVIVGMAEHRLAGRAAQGAFAVNLALASSPDFYWTLPVGSPDPNVPGELAWDASLDFARSNSPGPATILVQAVDGAQRAGATTEVPLILVTEQTAGELVVSLRWDTQADVDLHVRDPSGIDIGPENINSYRAPLPGDPPDPPDAWKTGGIYAFDSNAMCVLDGLRQETVSWQQAPPTGDYTVLVDLAYSCGQPAASYEVVVTLYGVEQQRAVGVLYAVDGRASPTSPKSSTGLMAVSFHVP